MDKKILGRLIELVQQGGDIALSKIESLSCKLKQDDSVLTDADVAVSESVRTGLADLLDSGRHILIGEEDGNLMESLDQSYLEKQEHIWVMDPIDGTRCFSNHLPSFGVSIGILKDLRPWMSAVYMPLLNELFFCDGKKSYFVANAFTKFEHRREITSIDVEITKQSIFWGNDTLVKNYDWDSSLCQMMHYSCAIFDLCYPALGRGCGSFFNSYIWDFAGSWPIYEAAGLKLRSMKNGKPVERLDVSLFQREGGNIWRFKDYHILSSERNFHRIQKALVSRH